MDLTTAAKPRKPEIIRSARAGTLADAKHELRMLQMREMSGVHDDDVANHQAQIERAKARVRELE